MEALKKLSEIYKNKLARANNHTAKSGEDLCRRYWVISMTSKCGQTNIISALYVRLAKVPALQVPSLSLFYPTLSLFSLSLFYLIPVLPFPTQSLSLLFPIFQLENYFTHVKMEALKHS